MRRFEFSSGSSNKFWAIDLAGGSFDVRWGRVGTDGQRQTKRFASAQRAKTEAEKLVRQKLAKGYVEIGGASKAKGKAKAIEAPRPPSLATWSRLLGATRTIGTIGKRSRPTIQILAEYEKRSKFRLPPGYRLYCRTFGGGEFCGYLGVFVPGESFEKFQSEWVSLYREI